LQSDPWEIHNVASAPEQQETLQRMRAVLEQWIKGTNDQGQYPEPPQPPEAPKKQKRKNKKNDSGK
jgi:hypothetical protein